MATKLEGVRTRFPCGPNVGTLADRYTSLDAVPLLSRIGAVQCGAAGYWYAKADLSARLRDAIDIETGKVIQVVDSAADAVKGAVGSIGKFAVVGGLFYVALMWITSHGQSLTRRRP